MKRKDVTLRLMLVLALALLLMPIGILSAQGRVGESKGKGLLLASVIVDDTPSPADLAGLLVGTGSTAPTISNVTYTGNDAGSGSFGGGAGNVGIESGVILGSGQVVDVVGPNSSDEITTDFALPGDSDLDGLIPGYTTYDAAVLEFDFECPEGTGGADVISFYYVFTSEEYNEWVGSEFNDVFGFFLNGTNIALLPDGVTPVSINNVNNDSNAVYYIDNDYWDLYPGPYPVDIEADGLTVVLGAEANINPGELNHMKLAIADAGDGQLDSWVFLEESSFLCQPLNQPPVADPNGPYVFSLDSGPFDGTGSYDPDGDPLTYAWTFGDGGTGTGVTPNHSYAEAGFYDVCLIVNDGTVDSEEVCTTAVIYDPNGGFVTGGGWIDSPAGAYYPSGLPCFDGSCYELVETEPGLPWDDANEAASASSLVGCSDVHLVTITSQEEQDALTGFYDGALQGKWYGGFQPPDVMDPEEGWQWVTGEPWEYTNWAEGEPNDNYGPGSEQHLIGWDDGWAWNDEGELGNVTGYVIEYDGCLTGKANFGFVSKYKKGASVPEGNTEFQFHAGDLNFHSSSYDWLVVTGSNFAKFKGVGTINGQGAYKFQIWAGDADPDTFRIKIWEEDGGETVIYDNGSNQEIGGGSIVVHTKK